MYSRITRSLPIPPAIVLATCSAWAQTPEAPSTGTLPDVSASTEVGEETPVDAPAADAEASPSDGAPAPAADVRPTDEAQTPGGEASPPAEAPAAPSCAPGSETCACYGNGTCNAGLVCASSVCVKLPPPPAAPAGASPAVPMAWDDDTPRAMGLGPDPSNYGGRVTLGIAIGGGGILGVPLRIYMTEQAALEIGVFYRPVIVINGGDTSVGGPMFAGGFDFYVSKKYVPRRHKVRLNGLFLKGGYGVSDLVDSSFVAAGWAFEQMREGNYSYSFSSELGPGVMFNDVKDPAYEMEETAFALYWKFHWSWALSPGF